MWVTPYLRIYFVFAFFNVGREKLELPKNGQCDWSGIERSMDAIFIRSGFSLSDFNWLGINPKSG
jgi:hypothetical protein